jgi:hypothetical protein
LPQHRHGTLNAVQVNIAENDLMKLFEDGHLFAQGHADGNRNVANHERQVLSGGVAFVNYVSQGFVNDGQ